ncbi:transcript variant X2 [Nothobranchius furzeri]|uniref:UAP56-interacting factor n=1 Tax=Nothobranchius furzeri TaxID=105023 RepID=A0A9D2YLV2_NOTFU|nr:transcript variant X2 [Nothobranchius furzeri]
MAGSRVNHGAGGQEASCPAEADRDPEQISRQPGNGCLTVVPSSPSNLLGCCLSPCSRSTLQPKSTSVMWESVRWDKNLDFILEPRKLRPRRSEAQRRLYRQPDPLRGQNSTSTRRPFQLRGRPPPPVQQTQREARQAMFLFNRGLKVQAQVRRPNPHAPPTQARQWRTSTTSDGILTVSIDNPSARTQPEPPTAWTLYPPPVNPAPVKEETVEKKIPKGVPLQFDINSVGKPQTSMTLNERFRILKGQRTAAAQSGKGSRFVTVG